MTSGQRETAGEGARATRPLVEARDISKRFGGVQALDGSRSRSRPGRCTAWSGRTARASRRSPR